MQWNNFGVVALRLLSVVVCDFIVVSCSAVDEPYSTVLCLSLPEYFNFKQESIYSRGTKSWRIYIRRNQSRRQSIQKEKGTTVCHQVFSYLSCAMYMYPDNKPIFTAVQCFFCLRILLMLSGIVILQSYENKYGLEVDTYVPKIFLREEFDLSHRSSSLIDFVHKNNLFGCIERKLWLLCHSVK